MKGGELRRLTPLTARTGLTRSASLARGGPLAPGKPLTRSAPIPRALHPDPARPTPQRRPTPTGVPTPTRDRVYDRDGHCCVRCGLSVATGNRQCHHRTPRGAGGRRDHARPSALILLCGWTGTAGCHGWVESHRDDARQAGWLVPAGIDPTTWPVLYPDGHRYLLDDDGDRRRIR